MKLLDFLVAYVIIAVLSVTVVQNLRAQGRKPTGSTTVTNESLSAIANSPALFCGTRDQLIATLKSIATDHDNGRLLMVGYIGKDGRIHALTAADLETTH